MITTWGVVVVIASGCVLMWTLLAAFFSRSSAHPSRRLAAAAAAVVVGPTFVVGELCFLAFDVGTTWPPMPWVIAGVGALAAAVLVPLMATQTPRLDQETRRRATTNIALLVIMCTLIAEAFAFRNALAQWTTVIVTILTLILDISVRRKRRAV